MPKKRVALRPRSVPHRHKEFFSLRDIRVASTSGHVVIITANKPTSLPEPLWSEAYKLGAMEFNPALIRAAAAAAEAAVASRVKPAAQKLAEMPFEQSVRGAVEHLLEHAKPAQLTAAGVPKISAVRAVLAKAKQRSEGLTSAMIYGIFGELQAEASEPAAPAESETPPAPVDESDLEDADGIMEPVGGGVNALLASATSDAETDDTDE